MITDYFDGALYINLDGRTDRKELAEGEFNKYGLSVERVSAVKGNPDGYKVALLDGEVGCILSHMKCIQIAKDRGWKSVLIFEDDVQLRDNFLTLANEYIQGMPSNWDMIYLGGNHWGCDLSMRDNPPLVRMTEHISRTTHTLTTHAYIMRDTMYDRTLELIRGMEKQADILYVRLQNEFNAYTMRPSLAWQRSDISDINNKQCDYYFIKDW